MDCYTITYTWVDESGADQQDTEWVDATSENMALVQFGYVLAEYPNLYSKIVNIAIVKGMVY